MSFSTVFFMEINTVPAFMESTMDRTCRVFTIAILAVLMEHYKGKK